MPGQCRGQGIARHAEFRQLHRLPGIPQPGNPQANRLAQRRFHFGRGGDTRKGAVAVESQPPRCRIGKIFRHATQIEREGIGGKAVGLEAIDGQRRSPVFAVLGAKIDREPGVLHRGRIARHRQSHRAARGISHHRIEDQLAQEIVRRGFRRGFQRQLSARELQPRDRQPATAAHQSVRGQLGIGAKERAIGRCHQRGQWTAEFGSYGKAFGLLVDRRDTRQRCLPIGLQGQLGAQIGHRALARHVQIDRRTTIEIQEVGNHPVSRLHQSQRQIDRIVRFGIVEIKVQRAAGPIEPHHVELGGQIAVLQRKRAGQRNFRAQPKHALAERHLGNIECLQNDRHRELGHLEPTGLSRWQIHSAFRRNGVAQVFDRVGLERLHFQSPEEQCRLAPGQRRIVHP